MQEDKIKLATFGDEAHQYIREAVDTMETAVGSTYGPGGRPMLLKKRYVDPTPSTDGVAVARALAGYGSKFRDDRATLAAKLIYQASEKTNKTAGDGTTATVVVLAETYKSGRKQIVSDVDPMYVKEQMDKASVKISDYIESKSIKCDKNKLVQVASIAGKDAAMGEMIADLVWDVGSDGAITIEYQNAPHMEVEKVTGYLFGQGFKILAQTVEFEEPMVLVSQKRISSKSDIIPLLELSSQTQKQFVIVGDVTGAALETLLWAIQNQKADGIVIPPPAYGADGHDYFEDIAIYTGARVFLESDSFSDLKAEDFGTVKKARVSRDKAILFGDNKTGKDIAARIATIREQMKGEMTPSLKEALETRLAKLAGKVSIVKVGAATEQAREELFFRVEDAVEASKSALSSGIVAGGATTLLFAAEELDIAPFIKEALQEPFRLIMKNAAYRADLRLDQTLKAGYGYGFNLRNMTEEPVNLIEAGVVDATKVVLQTVKNALSVSGGLLSAGGTITEEEDDGNTTNN